MRWLIVYLSLSVCLSKYFPPHVDETKANQNWEIVGPCGDDVFGIIRAALKLEYREVYLSIASGWMDKFLLPTQRVMVHCLTAQELEAGDALNIPSPSPGQEEQTLHVVYSLGGAAALHTDVAPVDRFLLRNPCWVLLKDQQRAAPAPSSSSTSTTASAAAPTRHGHSVGGVVVLHSSGESVTSVFPNYTSSSVLLLMPERPLGATCRLYSAVTRRQFPPSCPRPTELFRYAMQGFGFGGEANKVIKTFAFNLADSADRVYAAPLADKRDWIWADGSGHHCPHATFKDDPWACTFLSLSNCTWGEERNVTDLLPLISKGWGDYGPTKDTNHKTLNSIGVNAALLQSLGDGSGLSAEPATWASVRLYPFVLRPNFRTRALLRRGLDSRVVRLLGRRPGSATEVFAPVSVPVAVQRREGAWQAEESPLPDPAPASASASASAANNSSSSSSSSSLPQPQAAAPASPGAVGGGHATSLAQGLGGRSCLGMHVRNGDVLTDWRKGRKIDRSFNAHVYAALNLTRALAIQDIFLATDNSSLLHIAPVEYPSFRWFAQIRPLHPVESQALRGPLHHLHDTEPQREIANILLDAHLVGRCESLVGQGDGSVTLLFHMISCNLANAAAQCAPIFDLQWTADDGPAPYVGKRHDAFSFASFNRRKLL